MARKEVDFLFLLDMAVQDGCDDIVDVLDEQYRITQEYCNAQIILYNAHAARAPNHELDSAFVSYELATENVMNNMANLSTYLDIDAHKLCTKRILDTIYRQGAFRESGIPVNTSYDAKSTLVSLSILRASIQRIKDSVAK